MLNPYRVLVDPEVARVLSRYRADQTLQLFGITGDVDDLAKFVAVHGRAKAENLVDLINMLLKNYLEEWFQDHADVIAELAIIPSGEEPLVLGLTRAVGPVNILFQSLESHVNASLEPCLSRPVRISRSFGCALIDRTAIISDGAPVGLDDQTAQTTQGFAQYNASLENIRSILSRALDQKKFANLLAESDDYSIAFRNIVYFLTLKHKQETSSALLRLSSQLQDPRTQDLLRALSTEYGLSESAYALAELLVGSRTDSVSASDNPNSPDQKGSRI